MIRLILGGVAVPVRWHEFSDGALQCWVDPSVKGQQFLYASFSVCPSTPVSRIREEIMLLISALIELQVKANRGLICFDYLPYGRADRVFEDGNANCLQNFVEFLGDVVQPDEVFVSDPHNEEKLISLFAKTNITLNIKEQWECFLDTVQDISSGDVICAPDKGAVKKAEKLQMKLDTRGISCFKIQAEKERDLETGRIKRIGFTQPIDVKDKVVYIVDDICDGGGTFIPLAEELRAHGAKSIRLYVTHGIFSMGLDNFSGVIDKLYVHHTVGKFANKIDILNFNEGDV